jgi:hypothetical protein
MWKRSQDQTHHKLHHRFHTRLIEQLLLYNKWSPAPGNPLRTVGNIEISLDTVPMVGKGLFVFVFLCLGGGGGGVYGYGY